MFKLFAPTILQQCPPMTCRDVANTMGVAAEDQLQAGMAGGSSTGTLSESHAEIVKSCKEECRMYTDPTVMEQLQLQMAVKGERYEEASQCALLSVLQSTM